MPNRDFTISYEVAQQPGVVHDAVLDVRGWWSQRIEGDTDRLGEFVYTVPGIHRTRVRITELVPGRRVVWRVVDNWFAFDPDRDEWAGTEIRFDIEPTGTGSRLTFTHVGLNADLACYQGCATGWTTHVRDSLAALITTGTGSPLTPQDEPTPGS